MVADELTRALIEETTLEDISESYRPVVDIIGIEKFIELSEYAKGDELYFPKTENIIAPARNYQFDTIREVLQAIITAKGISPPYGFKIPFSLNS